VKERFVQLVCAVFVAGVSVHLSLLCGTTFCAGSGLKVVLLGMFQLPSVFCLLLAKSYFFKMPIKFLESLNYVGLPTQKKLHND